MAKVIKTPKQRLLEKAIVASEDECWIWTGATRDFGRRGLFRLNGKKISAHRASHILLVGPIPELLCVCHHCDNGLCINPKHLFLGTHTENMRDMCKKGRAVNLVGERHGCSKLTTSDVLEIKALAATGVTLNRIAEMFGVVSSHVDNIIHGRRWRHLTARKESAE